MEKVREKSSEVVKKAMKIDGLTQKELAAKCGKSTQSYVGNALQNSKGMGVDKFVEFMTAMGYDVVVRRGDVEMVVIG